MQPSYREFSAANASLRAGQLQQDNMLPGHDHKDAVEAECTRYAERFVSNDLASTDFHAAYDAFAGETVAGYLADDNDGFLLQLIIQNREDPLAKSLINRLYTAAYKHRESQLK